MLDWLERDEYVLSEFAVMPAVTIVAALVLSFFAARLYLTINRFIDQIRATS